MNRIVKLAMSASGAIVVLFVGLLFLYQLLPGEWNAAHWMVGPGMTECSGSGQGWGWIMPFLMVLVWAIVIWGIVNLIQSFMPSDRTRSRTDNQNLAMEVLKRRYAAGEIGREEYETKKHGFS